MTFAPDGPVPHAVGRLLLTFSPRFPLRTPSNRIHRPHRSIPLAVIAIGDFDVFTDKLLGKGGWGKVYLGRQRSLNRQVAIKFLNADMTKESDFVTRFRREAQCLASIQSDHIIQVYGAGEHEGAQWFAMEYVEGATLQKFVDKGRKFEEPEVCVIGLAVAKALRAAWNSPEKIVHRDIKPSNILVQTGGSPEPMMPYAETRKHGSSVLFTNFRNVKIKVMDFGLAKLKKEDNEKTLPGTVMGTPKYISPEQAQGKPADIRSDIYSLGVMMFQLATGRTPFEGDTAISLLSKHIYDEPPAPSSYDPKVSRELDSIVLKCLGKLPEERYQSPEALLEDIEAFLGGKRPRISMGDHTAVERKNINSTGVTIVRKKSKAPIFSMLLLLAIAGGVAAFGLVPPDGVKRDFVGNLKAHWAKWSKGYEQQGPKPEPGTGTGPDRLPTPDDPKAAKRQEAQEKLAEAARRADAGEALVARQLLEEARMADPESSMIAGIEAKVKVAEEKVAREKERSEAKAQFDALLKDARDAKEVKDSIALLEKAAELGKKYALEGLSDAEARLGDARARLASVDRYSTLLREAAEASDPEIALEKYKDLASIASSDQLTALVPQIEKRKADAADKHLLIAVRLEGEKKLAEAKAEFEIALGYTATNKEAQAGRDRVANAIPKDVVYVAGGKFLCGEPIAEKEAASFWIQPREATCDEWAAFLAAAKAAGKEVASPKSWSGPKPPDGQGGLPMRGAAFADVLEYAKWKGPGWRLPTEEEWEKASRGVDGRLYPWGNEFEAGKANVAKRSPVPLFPATMAGDVSPYGCFDMAGNVMEWTTSDYDTSKPIYKNVKTLRGGRYDSPEKGALLTNRTPGMGADALEAGFRLIWTPP